MREGERKRKEEEEAHKSGLQVSWVANNLRSPCDRVNWRQVNWYTFHMAFDASRIKQSNGGERTYGSRGKRDNPNKRCTRMEREGEGERMRRDASYMRAKKTSDKKSEKELARGWRCYSRYPQEDVGALSGACIIRQVKRGRAQEKKKEKILLRRVS